MMQICPSCGQEFSSGTVYCDGCGHPLPPPGDGLPIFLDPSTAPAATSQPASPEALPPEEPPGLHPALRLHLPDGRMIFEARTNTPILLGRKAARVKPDLDLTPFGALEYGVSRAHARITYQQGGYYVTDMGSRNETWLNGARLHPGQPYLLHHGDQVRLGMLRLLVLL